MRATLQVQQQRQCLAYLDPDHRPDDCGALVDPGRGHGSPVLALARGASRLAAEDLVRVLNRDVLIAVWPELLLPLRVMSMWESRFPELRSSAAA